MWLCVSPSSSILLHDFHKHSSSTCLWLAFFTLSCDHWICLCECVCVSAFDAPHPLSMLCSKIKPRKGEEKKSFSFCNLLQGWYRGRSITVRFKRSLLDSRLAINFFFLYSYHYMFFFFFSEQQAIKERKGKERKHSHSLATRRCSVPLGCILYITSKSNLLTETIKRCGDTEKRQNQDAIFLPTLR